MSGRGRGGSRGGRPRGGGADARRRGGGAGGSPRSQEVLPALPGGAAGGTSGDDAVTGGAGRGTRPLPMSGAAAAGSSQAPPSTAMADVAADRAPSLPHGTPAAGTRPKRPRRTTPAARSPRGSKTPPRGHGAPRAAALDEDEVTRIAQRLYMIMKPDIMELMKDRDAAWLTRRPSSGSGVGGDDTGSTAAGGSQGGAGRTQARSVGDEETMVRAVVREELDAFAERQEPALQKRDESNVFAVSGAMEAAVKRCLAEKPVELMSDEEVRKAMMVAIPTKTVRQNHGPVLNEAMKMFMLDPRFKNDALTMSFPASSALLETDVNEAFTKIVLAILQRIYKANGELAADKQPTIIRGKSAVVPDATDRADRAAMTQVRGALHDPRSRTRKHIFNIFLVYLMLPDASVELVHPDAPLPDPEKGEDAAYFLVRLRVMASCSGILPLDTGACTVPNKNDAPAGSPLSGGHMVERLASFYAMAASILVRLVREPYQFDKSVISHVAVTLRAIALSPDGRWKTMVHKDAEEQHTTGAWALLLPREHVRKEAEADVRTLSEKEKESILARHREGVRRQRGSGSEEPAPSVPPSSDGTSAGPADWLQLMSR